MTTTLQPRWIIGKTVASVDMNPQRDGRGGTAYHPVIRFTDGSMIVVHAVETEYSPASEITYMKPPKR